MTRNRTEKVEVPIGLVEEAIHLLEELTYRERAMMGQEMPDTRATVNRLRDCMKEVG